MYKYILLLAVGLCIPIISQGLRKFDTAKVVGADRCTMCHFNEAKAWICHGHKKCQKKCELRKKTL